MDDDPVLHGALGRLAVPGRQLAHPQGRLHLQQAWATTRRHCSGASSLRASKSLARRRRVWQRCWPLSARKFFAETVENGSVITPTASPFAGMCSHCSWVRKRTTNFLTKRPKRFYSQVSCQGENVGHQKWGKNAESSHKKTSWFCTFHFHHEPL